MPNLFDFKKVEPIKPMGQQVVTPQATAQNGGTPVQGSTNVPLYIGGTDTAGADYINSLFTPPAMEEKYRKASVANQKLFALADAGRHIANVVTAYNGAPAMQITNNMAVDEKQRYEKERDRRDANNARYYAYQQARRQQLASIENLKAQTAYQKESLDIRRKQNERLQKQYELNEKKEKYMEDLRREQLELNKKLAEHKITQEEYDGETRRIAARANLIRANKVGQDTESTFTIDEDYTLDEFGNKIGTERTVTKKTHHVGNSGGGGGKKVATSLLPGNSKGGKTSLLPK